MKKVRTSDTPTTARRTRPALTPAAREKQLIALAVDLVEKRLREGTASSQEVTQILKLGSARAELEKEMLKHQVELVKAKTESLQSAKRIEELYTNALKAMRSYSGQGGDDGDEY